MRLAYPDFIEADDCARISKRDFIGVVSGVITCSGFFGIIFWSGFSLKRKKN